MKSAPPVERRIADFVEACRRQGVKVTSQRVEILRELARTDEHPDVETVYFRVRKRIPSISLDTVYRTLRTFEEQGVVGRVGSMRDRARFDANLEPHHHFVCRKCGHIADFTSSEFDQLRPPAAIGVLGAVDSVYVEVRGLCAKCRKTP